MSRIRKRSIRISGHDTSVTLEDSFWFALQEIAKEKSISVNQLISEVDKVREENLSSALRLYVLTDLQSKANAQ